MNLGLKQDKRIQDQGQVDGSAQDHCSGRSDMSLDLRRGAELGDILFDPPDMADERPYAQPDAGEGHAKGQTAANDHAECIIRVIHKNLFLSPTYIMCPVYLGYLYSPDQRQSQDYQDDAQCQRKTTRGGQDLRFQPCQKVVGKVDKFCTVVERKQSRLPKMKLQKEIKHYGITQIHHFTNGDVHPAVIQNCIKEYGELQGHTGESRAEQDLVKRQQPPTVPPVLHVYGDHRDIQGHTRCEPHDYEQ